MAHSIGPGGVPEGYVRQDEADAAVEKVKAKAEQLFAQKKEAYEAEIAKLKAQLAQFQQKTVTSMNIEELLCKWIFILRM